MEMKKIALIDIDGCFSDYPNSLFLELVRKETGFNFNSKEEILDGLGISKYNLFKSMLRVNGLKIKYNFRTEALSTISFLKNKGYEIWINTSRPNIGENHKNTILWLKNNKVVYDHLIFTGKKGNFYLSPFELKSLIVIDDDDTAFIPFLTLKNVNLFKFGKTSKFKQVKGLKFWKDIERIL